MFREYDEKKVWFNWEYKGKMRGEDSLHEEMLHAGHEASNLGKLEAMDS